MYPPDDIRLYDVGFVAWKWSSMLPDDKALRAVPVQRLEGQNGAVKSDIREVFNKVLSKVFKSESTQLLLRMQILVLILSMMGMCGVRMLMQANAQAQGAGGFRRRPPA